MFDSHEKPALFDLETEYDARIRPLMKQVLAECEALNIPFVYNATVGVHPDGEGVRTHTHTSLHLPDGRTGPEAQLISQILAHADGETIQQLLMALLQIRVEKVFSSLDPERAEALGMMLNEARETGTQPSEAAKEMIAQALYEGGIDVGSTDNVKFMSPSPAEQNAKFN